jgi:hypothetical protein
MLVKRFEIKRMHNFLSNDNVVGNSPTLNEGMLELVDIIW